MLISFRCFISQVWQRLRKFTGGVIDRLFMLAYLAMVVVTMIAVFRSLLLLDLPPVFRCLSTIEHVSLKSVLVARHHRSIELIQFQCIIIATAGHYITAFASC